MGEIADMMIEGTLCQKCGFELGEEGEGYPRYCKGCSDESSEGGIWAEHKKETQERHADWWEKNTKALNESGLPFRAASHESYLFRETGKPNVDFYPSTGRWRVCQGRNRNTKTFSGGALSFINWYKKL